MPLTALCNRRQNMLTQVRPSRYKQTVSVRHHDLIKVIVLNARKHFSNLSYHRRLN